MIITLIAKTNDLNCIRVIEDASPKTQQRIGCNKEIILDYEGYVPPYMCLGDRHDSIVLTIDVETGKIIDWDSEKVKETINDLRSIADE